MPSNGPICESANHEDGQDHGGDRGCRHDLSMPFCLSILG